jgi:hypothetical protein
MVIGRTTQTTGKAHRSIKCLRVTAEDLRIRDVRGYSIPQLIDPFG